MWRWFLITLLGMAVLMAAVVLQLVAVVVCSEGDPTLILCSIVIGNSVATTLLVFWCHYTERVWRDRVWREKLLSMERDDAKGPSKVRR
jgi:hypothetical protein